MATTEELRIVITAQDQASRVLQNLGQQTSRTSSVIQGAVAGATAAVVSRGMTLIADALEVAARAVVGFNASLEQSRIAWATMLGGADQARAMLAQLQQFARETPFEFPDVERAGRRMLAMGFAARDVIPILRDVGNAAAALGLGNEGIDRITLALGQMSTRTKVSAEDMLQLTEVGVPAWRILAEATGKSIADVQDAASKGVIPAQTFIDAFRRFSQANYGGLMEQQSRTFSGAMSNIKDSLDQLGAQAFEPVFMQLRDLAVAFGDWLGSTDAQQFFQTLRAGLLVLGRVLQTFGQAWANFANTAIVALNAVGEAWTAFWTEGIGAQGQTAFGQVLDMARQGWGGFVEIASAAVNAVMQKWADLIAFLQDLRGKGAPLGPFEGLADQTVNVTSATEQFTAALQKIPAVALKAFEPFQRLKEFVSDDIWQGLQDAWQQAWSEAGAGMVQQAGDIGGKAGSALGNAAVQAAKPLLESLTRMLAQLRAGPVEAALQDTEARVERAKLQLQIRGLAPEERQGARATIRDLERNVLPGQRLAAFDVGQQVTLAQRAETTATLLQQIADTSKQLADAGQRPIGLTVNVMHDDGRVMTYSELIEANTQAQLPPVVPQSGVRR